jgi:hypothetical protein
MLARSAHAAVDGLVVVVEAAAVEAGTVPYAAGGDGDGERRRAAVTGTEQPDVPLEQAAVAAARQAAATPAGVAPSGR